jgi:hypothetical protein
MRADYKNTKVGDKIRFRESTMHWFTNRIENAKKLVSGQVYTVKKISVDSSSTGVMLEETGELEYELCWFDKLENMNTEIETLTKEFEQILSLKEDTKLEEAGYTKNTEEWIEHLKTNLNDEEISNGFIFDYEIIKNAEAFALGPVFSYEGKVKACFSAKYNSLVDLKESLKGKKYILYVVFCTIASEPVGPIETRDLFITFKDNFSPIDRIGKNPKIRYIFRGHILD